MNQLREQAPAAISIAALLGACVLCVHSALQAIGLERIPERVTSSDSVPPAEWVRLPSVTVEMIAAGADRDPFSPERKRVSEGFIAPVSLDHVITAAPTVPELPVVLGTTIVENGRNLALLRVGSSTPRTVQLRDTLNGMRVERIRRGTVELQVGDSIVVVSISRTVR